MLKSGYTVFLTDLTKLEKAGITHPDIKKIKMLLK